MKIRVYTRSLNDELYSKMASLLPNVDLYPIKGENGYTQALTYLVKMLDNAIADNIDYAINIDEDCFITDWGEVLSIIDNMQGYTHAGMPDGGVCEHRYRSWAVHNPFFNVFNIAEIKKIAPINYNYRFANIINPKEPIGITSKFNHDTGFEPFDGLFYYLHDKGKPLNLTAITHDDNISTGLIFNKMFCWHSWYSREYNGAHKKRINDLFLLSQQAHNKH
jgi:hypothetical protein